MKKGKETETQRKRQKRERGKEGRKSLCECVWFLTSFCALSKASTSDFIKPGSLNLSQTKNIQRSILPIMNE